MGIRKTIYGLLNLGAESTVTTQATAVIQSLSGSLALVPSGSGALTANIPDGTVAGGNARGTGAVDLCMVRSAANRVASGNYTFIAGNDCFATGANAIAIGTQSYGSAQNAVAIGRQNAASGNNATAIGIYLNSSGTSSTAFGDSNTASSSYSGVLSGLSNTASNTHATVVGGHGNTVSGQYGVSGGYFNTVSGNLASLAFGLQNNVSGLNSIALGGNHIVSGNYSIGLGYESRAYLHGGFVNSSGRFSTVGDAQQSSLTARKQDTLTTGATSSLSLDGTGTTNLIIPSGANRTWNTTVNWVATVTGSSGTTTGVTVGDSIYGVSEFGFKVSASIASITPLIRDSIVADTTIMETATLTYATGSSNSLAMTFTAPTFAGGGSLGIRVVAKVSLVELAW